MKVATRDELMEWMSYDEHTGVFTWRKSNKRWAKPGAIAGGIDTSTGYWRMGFLGKNYYAHRLAWLFVHGEMPSLQIDHIDGNRTNNIISNLRLATQSENNQNQRVARKNRSSTALGVHLNKKSGRWISQIGINGKVFRLGTFDSEKEASDAYLKAKKELHPFQTIVP